MPNKLSKPLGANQFYCVKCRMRVTLPASDICVKSFRNKRTGSSPALVGECSKCGGTHLTKWISPANKVAMTKKYGKC